MRQLTYRDAVREALGEEMDRDERVVVFGEDVEDPMGGSYKVTLGLSTRFGTRRVRNTPISEAAIAGAAVGAAAMGLRPVAEIMYMDFLGIAADQIVNQAAKLRYMSGGQIAVPLVIRCQGGAGRSAGAQHSQSLEAWFAHVPGLKMVMPSSPAEAKGLLKAAIRDDNPVIFFEHNLLYNVKGPVADEDYVLPLDKAEIKRPGTAVTIVSWSRMLTSALQAADQLQSEFGVDAEVIDLRTVNPLDIATIVKSVKKTGKLVIAHEATVRGGLGAEIAAEVYEQALDWLDAEVKRVGTPFTPVPFAPKLEKSVLRAKGDIVEAVKSML